jgi:hypothetical protein
MAIGGSGLRTPAFAGDIRREREPSSLLAMQKVEGSNPFSRFEKGLHLQAFLVCAVGWCVCAAGHPMGTRPRNARQERLRTSLLAGIS